MVTKEQALTAREFHSAHYAKPGCMTWRRNGTTKVWKTRPTEFRVPVKFGLYTYSSINHFDAYLFHTAEDCDIATMCDPVIHVVWEDDWEIGDHTKEFDGYDTNPETCERAMAYVRDPKTDRKIILASLGCIDDADDDYRKEIEAELINEAKVELKENHVF